MRRKNFYISVNRAVINNEEEYTIDGANDLQVWLMNLEKRVGEVLKKKPCDARQFIILSRFNGIYPSDLETYVKVYYHGRKRYK